MSDEKQGFFDKIELSAVFTVIGIILLFSASVAVILIAPYFTETTWRQPTTFYQVQMYEVSDPNFYISSTGKGATQERQLVYHIKKNFTLLAFEENEFLRITSSPELEKYITKKGDEQLKLTSRLLLLRAPSTPSNEVGNELELYEPEGDFAFARATTDGIIDNWVENNYVILEENAKAKYHNDPGVIYVSNPQEYRIIRQKKGKEEYWRYDAQGIAIASLDELQSLPLHFMSRKELIRVGEQIYAAEGCYYCHTDQTRTLVQDVVANGSDSYPAPPSSPNEYIYQEITFPGTRRIGPDLSRVGVKRPSRDWHKGHFWSPKTASQGTIMPAFRHFFDRDPSGTSVNVIGIPNYQFEAIFQYLMTKGTRITPPTEAWWLGKDPIQTKEVIEGRKKI